MSLSVKKWSPEHKARAQAEQRVLYMWDMDKRWVADVNDRSRIQACGTIPVSKAKRIWAIINEKEAGE